jgi:hypothetical protein
MRCDKAKGKAGLLWLEKCLRIEQEIIEENLKQKWRRY